MKSLVVFYSRTGKTRLVAKTISWEVNGSLLELREAKRRKEGTATYVSASFDAIMNRKSKLEPFEVSIGTYDVIFIGSPIWVGRLPPAINTFISSVDLKDKRIVAFFTMDSNDHTGALKDFEKKVARKSGKVIGSFAIRSRNVGNKDIVSKAKELVDAFQL
jgi:flavodoxin